MAEEFILFTQDDETGNTLEVKALDELAFIVEVNGEPAFYLDYGQAARMSEFFADHFDDATGF